MKALTSVAAVSAFLAATVAGKSYHCPPLGQTLPAPKNPSASGAIETAVQRATELFQDYVQRYNNTAASLTVKSIHEDDYLLNLHHTPETRDERGTAEVSCKTVYRVGSVSKLFAPLAILREAGVNIHDPITKYLPELKDLENQQEENNALTTISWDDVTLLSLASHMGGFASEMAQDIGNFGLDETPLGLPTLEQDDIPGCSGLGGNLLAKYGKHRPAWAPFTTPMYSNVAFSFLSFVIEQVTNKTFDEHVQESIFTPLGMDSTTSGAKPEDDASGFIPAEDPWWFLNLGVFNPAGGFFSNTEDLVKLGEGILNHDVLSAVETRKWMKPTEHTASLGVSVGAPWEIFRTKNLTTDGRIIDVYSKTGDLGPYHAIFALVPDYDLVFTLLTGGPEASNNDVVFGTAQLMQILLPALDLAAKEEAAKSLIGEYVDEETNSTITLSVDDGPGLAVSNWVSRGVDVVESYGTLLGIGEPVKLGADVTVRLYNTGLSADNQSGWRAVLHIGAAEDFLAVDETMSFIPQVTCQTWFMFERTTYGFNSLDDFVFTVGEDGTVEEVTSRFYRTTMTLASRE
ncbi:hypothetical protein jhhlp_000155 [Lomentospora prolificans]|uniref:Uncharacterized protein n=1 Tax=Lomentospora prolificans TaxID=41688 RepID=A0A2N3NLS3_9PEZI|nr:hypothetical protein jhhlp_000155 [Lomentospora prolificans]